MVTKPTRGVFKFDYQGLDAAAIKHALANRLLYSVGKDPLTATDRDWFNSAAYVVRDRLIERWMETMRTYYRADAKRVYYLSLEFLIGRVLSNSLMNMGCYEEFCQVAEEIGLDLRQLKHQEPDAALGNGGLGRLAACFLDSMATMRLPGYGYGIRYEYGMFSQRIENGYQVEHPDNWLRYGNPWEFPRPELLYPVKFKGRSASYVDHQGDLRHQWVDTENVMAMAYDTPIPGYGSNEGALPGRRDCLRTRAAAQTTVFLRQRIISITNGITPRRWLNQANRGLAELVGARIGPGWVTDLSRLGGLEPVAEDPEFQRGFQAVKREAKERLRKLIRMRVGIEVKVDSLFDVQVKRIHEYKRQLLNLLHVITLYNRLITDPNSDRVTRTVIFAGKSAPGYVMAKLIIKLIHDVAETINNDRRIGERLKVVFVPNYDVSTAADIVAAADLSEQISTAGTEASGTGNMKLALNGALTIGTRDGANIEILEEVGEDNMFIFGLAADQVSSLRSQGYEPIGYYHNNAELRQAMDMIGTGYFCTEEPRRFAPIIESLTTGGDRYLVLADYADFVACQERVDSLYCQPAEWARKAILNVANMGKFSSDRTIAEYARRIWNVKPVAHE